MSLNEIRGGKCSSADAYLRAWRAEYRRSRSSSRATETVRAFGYEVDVFRGVFNPSPALTNSTKMVVDAIGSVTGKRVLDVGTGTGILSLICADKGAEYIVGADDADLCRRNAEANMSKYGFSDVFTGRCQDVFVLKDSTAPRQMGQPMAESFDLILGNLDMRPKVPYDGGVTRPKKLLPQVNFVQGVASHLVPGGRALLTDACFSQKTAEIEEAIDDSTLHWSVRTEQWNSVLWRLYIGVKSGQ